MCHTPYAQYCNYLKKLFNIVLGLMFDPPPSATTKYIKAIFGWFFIPLFNLKLVIKNFGGLYNS